MQGLAYLLPVLLWIGGLSSAWALTAEISLLFAVPLAIKLHRTPSSPTMNPLLGQTSQTLFFYCLFQAAGLILQRLVM